MGWSSRREVPLWYHGIRIATGALLPQFPNGDMSIITEGDTFARAVATVGDRIRRIILASDWLRKGWIGIGIRNCSRSLPAHFSIRLVVKSVTFLPIALQSHSRLFLPNAVPTRGPRPAYAKRLLTSSSNLSWPKRDSHPFTTHFSLLGIFEAQAPKKRIVKW
jgi:hypothetical protein